MARLLVVHHSPSLALESMLAAVTEGASNEHIEGVEVISSAALSTGAASVLEADGIILGTPANLGYMSGALKHFFDTIYNPCLDQTAGRPFGVFVHGNSDTNGALLSIEKVTTGLNWRLVTPPVCSLGQVDDQVLGSCWELGAVLAATLMS